MKLLTAELRTRLPRLYSQEKVPDPIVHAKFFTPDSNWTWYVTEVKLKKMIFGSLATSAAWRRNGATSCSPNSNRSAAPWDWQSSAISTLRQVRSRT
jgi:hypothetical protein